MNKRDSLFAGLIVTIMFSSFISVFSQESPESKFRAGSDFYSSFVWRGSRLGSGPAVQPVIEFTNRSFTAGAWGSIDFSSYEEVDLYLAYSFPAGFTFGFTDYYLPDLKYFDYSRETGSHAFELNLGFTKENFSLSANYIFNEAGGVGSVGQDLYFQADYSFKLFGLFAGAGNGWHTYDPETGKSDFNICNVGIEVSKTIEISETFGIPLICKLIFNPDKEQLFLVIGFTIEP
jgi:hypothetical protein